MVLVAQLLQRSLSTSGMRDLMQLQSRAREMAQQGGAGSSEEDLDSSSVAPVADEPSSSATGKGRRNRAT
jgi:hypothetical protein